MAADKQKDGVVPEDDSQVIERHNIPIHGTGAVAVEVLSDGVSVAVQDTEGGIICSVVVGLDEILGKSAEKTGSASGKIDVGGSDDEYAYLVSVAVGEVVAAWRLLNERGVQYTPSGHPEISALISSAKTLAELLEESVEGLSVVSAEDEKEQGN